MAANTTPIFLKTISTGIGKLNTANTAKDGTGTIVTLFTAGTEGGRIEKIIFMPSGSITETIARIFVNNGQAQGDAANNNLVAEATIPAYSSGLATPVEVILDLPLSAGYKINTSINAVQSSPVHATGIGGQY